jgi:polar amino acid transport system substrate-binding protein
MQVSKLIVITLLMSLCCLVSAENQVITISTNNTPLDRKALQLLSQEAFRRVGLEPRLISTPSERSLQMANQGEVDGEGLRIAGLNAQYPNLIQIPERFIGISFVAFSRDAMINLNQGWESLKPHRVAFITGWKMFEANASGARVVNRVSTPEQMFRMLEGGRIDVALYTRADGIHLIRSMNLGSIAPLSPALKDVDMYLYLHKKHESLVPQIAKALREMKADGSYNQIMFSISAE